MTSTKIIALADVRRATRSGRARAVREAAQISQSEVARALGVSQGCVSLWESNRRVPRGKAALRYGAMLNALEERQAVP